jgi:hypothetical protein
VYAPTARDLYAAQGVIQSRAGGSAACLSPRLVLPVDELEVVVDGVVDMKRFFVN